MSAANPRRPRAPRPPAMKIGLGGARRAEAWLWTGPVGHLVAGSLDWAQALGLYGLARARGRLRRELPRTRRAAQRHRA